MSLPHIILTAHGSRRTESNQEVRRLVEQLGGDWVVDRCGRRFWSSKSPRLRMRSTPAAGKVRSR